MTSVVIGKIKRKDKNTYTVKMFKGKLKATFRTLERAVAFTKDHAVGILLTDETSAVAVKYQREDRRISYLIWESSILGENRGILEYEECEYDYITTHRSFFPKRRTRRMINERYYSFHDFARTNTLTSSFSAFAKLSVNVAAMIMAFVFLFYGLHASNMSIATEKMDNLEKLFLNAFTIIGTVATLVIAITSSISYGYPIYKLVKVKWNYDEIDWRKLNKLRKHMKIICLTVAMAGLGFIAFYFTEYTKTELWINRDVESEGYVFFVISICTSILFSLIGIFALTNIMFNHWFKKTNLNKYFSREEIKEFKKWIKFKSERVTYKTDYKYFVFPLKETINIALAKIEMTMEVEKSSTDYEMKQYKKKALRHYKLAEKTYLKSDKYKEKIYGPLSPHNRKRR